MQSPNKDEVADTGTVRRTPHVRFGIEVIGAESNLSLPNIDMLCIACNTFYADVAHSPCGHVVMCELCAINKEMGDMYKNLMTKFRCPVCKDIYNNLFPIRLAYNNRAFQNYSEALAEARMQRYCFRRNMHIKPSTLQEVFPTLNATVPMNRRDVYKLLTQQDWDEQRARNEEIIQQELVAEEHQRLLDRGLDTSPNMLQPEDWVLQPDAYIDLTHLPDNDNEDSDFRNDDSEGSAADDPSYIDDYPMSRKRPHNNHNNH